MLIAVAGSGLYLAERRSPAASRTDSARPASAAGSAGCRRWPTASSCSRKEDLMPDTADRLAVPDRPVHQLCGARSRRIVALPFAGTARFVARTHSNVAVFFMLAVLGLEVFGVILAGYCVGLEVVALRGDARGGPGRQLRSPAGSVRRGAGDARRHDGPGDDRQHAGGLVIWNWHRLPRPVHVRRLLGLLHLRDGERQPRPVRPRRGRERAGRRASTPSTPASAGASSSWPSTRRCCS